MGSPAQKSKLRNGHKVRIKHGAGFNVIVNPNTYHLVSRAFLKNKGISLQLSPDELMMNKSPSPELQQQIMGHNQHMIIPGVIDHINMGGRGLGTGIGDFFKNLGHSIKSGFENQIINPIKDTVNKIIPGDVQRDIGKVGNALSLADMFKQLKEGKKPQDIIKDKYNAINSVYKERVPEEIRRDINTAVRYSTLPGAAIDLASRLKRGDRIDDIVKGQYEDLKHLNDTKNKIIKSNPALTEAYKKGVMATAGLGSAALGSAFGLSPATGALAGLAATKGAEQLLKAEGYGLHHIIDYGMHKYNKHKKHRNPIDGMLGRGHITDFFKNAGKKVKDIFHSVVQTATPYVEKGKDKLSRLHEFILKNPALGAKIKEHGSKLAGILAKEGVKYMGGSEEMADLAGKVGEDAGKEGIKHVGYGEERKPTYNPSPYKSSRDGQGLYSGRQMGRGMRGFTLPPKGNGIGNDIERGGREGINRVKNLFGHGIGNDIERGGREGINRVKNLFGRGIGNDIDNGIRMGIGKIRGLVGEGLYSGSPIAGGAVFNSYDSLHNATMGYYNSNKNLARMSDNTVYGQHEADPIKRYWDADGQPRSRGTGLHKHSHGKVHHSRSAGYEKSNHYNLVRGRGTLLEHKSHLPPALQSQPYGANFNMQNMLPPQYQKYNDGTNEY